MAKQVAARLAEQRAALHKACWRAEQRGTPPLAEARWSFNYTFDAQGKQLARGVTEERRASSYELTQCVLSHLAPVEVEPPGATVQVNVPFVLP